MSHPITSALLTIGTVSASSAAAVLGIISPEEIKAATTVAQLRKALRDLDEYQELVEDAENERAGKQVE